MSSSGVATAGPGSTRVTVDGPGSTMTVYRERAGVAHLQYMVDPVRPWFGRPPWASASLSGNLARRGRAATERRRRDPRRDTSSRLRTLATVARKARTPTKRRRIRSRRCAATWTPRAGKTMLAPTTSAGFGAGPGAAPSTDYKSERFGFNPPASAVETRRDVERSILAACGVPPVLAQPSGSRQVDAGGVASTDRGDRRAAGRAGAGSVVRGARREGLPDDATSG